MVRVWRKLEIMRKRSQKKKLVWFSGLGFWDSDYEGDVFEKIKQESFHIDIPRAHTLHTATTTTCFKETKMRW